MATQRREDAENNGLESAEELNGRTEAIIASAIEVHRHLGPGLLESIYEACLAHELRLRGHSVRRQVAVPVYYKGQRMDVGFRLDLLVDEAVIVEVKSARQLHPVFAATTLSYIRLSDLRVGLLLNFNVEVMKHGIKRVVNGFPD